MKISGFTFIRNGIQLRYPFIESIQSILPLCDEMIVAVGNSSDGTRDAIVKLQSEKIKIIDTVWDESQRESGKILPQQTDIAFDAITGDWGFYLQGDEVIHENDLQKISDAAKKNLNEHSADGLLFKWLHFFGSYDYIAKPMSRGAYPFEVRLIKNSKEIRSYRDAQGFRKFSHDASEKMTRLRVKKIDATVYHYGKVRGPVDELERAKSFNRLWHDDEWIRNFSEGKNQYEYVSKFPLVKFTGTHPAVMKERITVTNWNFIPDKKNIQIPFKYKMLNALQSAGGWRPFEFRNYVVV
ncbi:MAG: glycosyltransferase family 2 protein [Chitinophagales bacterium]